MRGDGRRRVQDREMQIGRVAILAPPVGIQITEGARGSPRVGKAAWKRCRRGFQRGENRLEALQEGFPASEMPLGSVAGGVPSVGKAAWKRCWKGSRRRTCRLAAFQSWVLTAYTAGGRLGGGLGTVVVGLALPALWRRQSGKGGELRGWLLPPSVGGGWEGGRRADVVCGRAPPPVLPHVGGRDPVWCGSPSCGPSSLADTVEGRRGSTDR